MLQGKLVGLRARTDADVAVLHEELYNDVPTRSRADNRPWRPLAVGRSPYIVGSDGPDNADHFSVFELATGELAGEALLWGIDTHNRSTHLGLSLRPHCRGRGLGQDALSVLCRYAFSTRGLHRVQLETLSDNTAMIGAAERLGFQREALLRQSAWVNGGWADDVIFGLLADEFTPGTSA